MNFLSFEFVAFFIAFLLIYWLPFNALAVRNVMLIVASYAFVAVFNLQFAYVLLGYSLFIYVLANHADRFLRPRQIYMLLAVGIVSLFVLFKYYAFFQETIQTALLAMGLQVDLPILSLLLPIGLSYYSFHSVSYVQSVQRQDLPKAPFNQVLLYLCFFPSIVAGPINNARHFMPQIQNQQRCLLEPKRAFFLLTLALLKLFLFSAWLAENWVDPVFADPGGHSPEQNMLAVYAYAWVIYFNFSGYTDLVTGFALFLGFRLPVNFNAPYLALHLKEFWTRWHISLSSFIRDYVYIPLGGGRQGWGRTQVNVLLAMVISGLWHGAALTFVIWGALHGLGVIALNLKQRLWPGRVSQRPLLGYVHKQTARLLCFNFVCLAWVFFRSDSLEKAIWMLHSISTVQLHVLLAQYKYEVLALLLLFLSYPWLVRMTERLQAKSEQVQWWYYPVVLAAVLSLALSLAPDGMPNFIYASF